VGDLQVPNTMVDALNHYNNDQREVEYFILEPKAAGDVGKPDEKTQLAFLEENKPLFTAPEYRKIGLLSLSLDDLKKKIKISEEDIKADYAERIDQFSIPGKRHIRRMSFIDPEEAKKAKKELDGGADFMAVAKKYKFREKDADLGFVDKADIAQSELANAAFEMKEGEIRGPINSGFTHIIVQVVAIRPGKTTKKLADVRGQIREFLAAERASEQMGRLHDSIEDEKAAGLTLAQIAKKLGLAYKTIEAVDRSGLGPDGKPARDMPSSRPLLRAVFESDIGVDNDAVEENDALAFWFEVLSITPQRLKKPEEVKDRLIAEWQKRERARKLGKLASNILADLRGGAKISDMAKKYGAELKKSKPFSRREEHDDLPVGAVSQAFVLPVGGYGMASLAKDRGKVIFKLAAAREAQQPDEKNREKLALNLRRQMENDIISQYVSSLRRRFGVKVHEKVLNRILGANS
jgi:peptidyl-prolyl cis-trans isomerase D